MTVGMHLASTSASRSSSLRSSSRSPELFGPAIARSASFAGSSLARFFPFLNDAHNILDRPERLGRAHSPRVAARAFAKAGNLPARRCRPLPAGEFSPARRSPPCRPALPRRQPSRTDDLSRRIPAMRRTVRTAQSSWLTVCAAVGWFLRPCRRSGPRSSLRFPIEGRPSRYQAAARYRLGRLAFSRWRTACCHRPMIINAIRATMQIPAAAKESSNTLSRMLSMPGCRGPLSISASQSRLRESPLLPVTGSLASPRDNPLKF